MPWSDDMIPPEESIHDAQLDSIAEDELFDLDPSRIMNGHAHNLAHADYHDDFGNDYWLDWCDDFDYDEEDDE